MQDVKKQSLQNEREKRPSIHVTEMGTWYVEADELLSSEKASDLLDKMASVLKKERCR